MISSLSIFTNLVQKYGETLILATRKTEDEYNYYFSLIGFVCNNCWHILPVSGQASDEFA
jgi:hypothetical protein